MKDEPKIKKGFVTSIKVQTNGRKRQKKRGELKMRKTSG